MATPKRFSMKQKPDFSERLASLSPEKRRLLEQRIRRLETRHAVRQPLFKQDHEGPFLASFAQARLWLLDQLYEGNILYNEPSTLRLRGTLDVTALRYAMDQTIQRHEALRTTFAAEQDSLFQIIQPARPFDLPLIDLRHLSEDERESEWRRLAKRFAHQPFDLQRDLMIRGRLYQLADDEHVLLLVKHHIASDLTSRRIFDRELEAHYNARVENRPAALPTLSVQYKAYASWQHTESNKPAHAAQLAYWQEHLAGMSALELPADRPRPAHLTTPGAFLEFELAGPLVSKLRALARAEQATMYMLLLAAFNVLLQRYTGQDDIAVGSPVTNRDLPEFDQLIGFFINSLVMRSDLSGSPSFRELLARVRHVVLSALEHHATPFEQVIAAVDAERQLNRNPLFEVLFQVVTYAGATPNLHQMESERVSVDYGIVKFDCDVSLQISDDKIMGKWRYPTDLFEEETIQRMATHFVRLLEAVADDADCRLDQLEMLSAGERRQQLVEWNQSQTGSALNKTVPALVTEQARRTPQKTAVTCAGENWSYAELEQHAGRLAHQLRRQGVGPETLVGLYVERSLDMLAGLLGILKAGGAFVPLDPYFPAARVEMMLADARPALIVTQRHLAGRLAEGGPPLLFIDGDELPRPAGEETGGDGAQSAAAGPENLAYVIYTSGSTGQPKGIQITHQALANFLMAGWHPAILSADDRLLAVTTMSFDIALFDLFLPLIHGAEVVIAPREAGMDAALLADLVAEQDITILQATPATFRLLMMAEWAGKHDLTIVCGGEELPPDLAGELLPRCRALWNAYGPTETTIYSTRCQIRSAAETITIGRPIANTQVYILDDALLLLPVGAIGQLYIAGEGLARGYLNEPAMTAERFLPNPFGIAGHGRVIYKTGDLGRFLPDGRIVILGRNDFQVKVRGFRIELGEIEAAVARQPAVAQNITAVLEDDAGDKRLVTYWIPRAGLLALPTDDELRAGLRTILPDYMIPSRFVMLDALPLTPGGKIDRQALADPGKQNTLAADHVTPQTYAETAMANIWCDVLNLSSIGRDDDFFAIGGHSLQAMRLIAAIERRFGIKLPLRVLFDFPTVAGLAGQLIERVMERPPE